MNRIQKFKNIFRASIRKMEIIITNNNSNNIFSTYLNSNKLINENTLNKKILNENKINLNKKTEEAVKTRSKLTNYDKQIELEKLDKFISKYPKGQLCSYYLRGLCWKKNMDCQFAHGVSDLNFENLLKFSENRKKGLVEYSEIAMNIQKYGYLINKNYQILYNYLLINKKKKFPLQKFNLNLDEINKSSKNRQEIRKFMLEDIFDEFILLFFYKTYEKLKLKNNQDIINNNNINNSFSINNENINDFQFKEDCKEEDFKKVFCSTEEFETIIKDVGLKINYKNFGKNKILTKSVFDKKIKKKKSIVRLMPDSISIFNGFVEVILKALKEMNAEEFVKLFPLNFKNLNEIVIKNLPLEEPFIFNYMNLKNISYSEFMEEIKSDNNFIENLDRIVNEKNEEIKNSSSQSELISKNNYFHEENLDELVNEFRYFLWEKYFNKLESENYIQKYGFMPYEFIRENFFDFSKKKLSYQFSENTLNNIIRKILLFEKNIFFINNNYKVYLLNFHFLQNLKLSEYFQEGKLEQRCNKTDENVQKIVQEYFHAKSVETIVEDEHEPINENITIFAILERKLNDLLKTNINCKKQARIDLNKSINDKNNNLIENSKIEDKITKENFKKNDPNEILSLTECKISICANIEEEIVIVDDIRSLINFILKSRDFSLLALDLEGRLSSTEAEINLIQIYDNTSKKIFVIDIFKINYLSGSSREILFECLQIILTYIMESEAITKVFHDGRKDIASLHCVFKCCATNYIDTSCIYSFLNQLDVQIELFNAFYLEKINQINLKNKISKNLKSSDIFFEVFFSDSNIIENINSNKNKDQNMENSNDQNLTNYEDQNISKISKSDSPKSLNKPNTFNKPNYTNNHQITDYDIANVHSLINNLSSPGLNKILESYEPNGQTNYLKEKMHELMGSLSMKNKLFTDRPINKEFLLYSAMDVKFLISSLKKMEEELKDKIIGFYPDIKNINFDIILRMLSYDHKKTYCYYE